MTFRYLLLLGLMIVMIGCGKPQSATPAATPEAIKIYYPASLQPWADKLSDCAASFPQVALYFLPPTGTGVPIGANDIRLALGQPSAQEKGAYLTQVGEDQVVFIVNKANPLFQLTVDQLKQVYSGQMVKWEDANGQLIQVWVMPEGESTRQMVDKALNLVQLQALDAYVAPDPQAMLEAVSADKAAVDYLLKSFLEAERYVEADQVKVIVLDNALIQELSQPVIASTQGEPSGYTRGLIACLQKSSSP